MWTRLDRRGFLQAAGVFGGTMLVSDLRALVAHGGTRGDTLRVAVDRDFQSLRPDIWTGDTNYILKRLIYTTPILWGTKPRSDGTLMYATEEVELVLATGYRVSEDRQTIEFTLRRDAKFANGDPITAHAVKASYDWHLDNGGPGSGQLKVNGLPSKDRIEAIDEHVLRLHLDRPVSWGLIGNALLISCSIVHAAQVRVHATADDPFGVKWLKTKTIESGPYVIDNWQKGSLLVLRPNPHYFAPPKIQRIILQIVPDPSMRRIMLEKGDVDIATEIATKDIPDLTKTPGVKVLSYPSMRAWFLGMSYRKEPFSDPQVRRAIAWAVPYEALMRVVTHGLAERHRSPIPANCSGYTGDYWPYETNLEKARDALAQSKFAGGFEVNVPVYAGDVFDEEINVLLRESLSQLGTRLNLQKMPFSQKSSVVVKKQVDMATYPWRPWVTDAGYFIYWNWLPESFSNYWSYENPEAQRLGNEAITMPIGSAERNEKLRRFQELVCKDLGIIPLFTQFDNYAMRDRVSDFVYYPDKVVMMSKLSLV